MTPQTPLGQLTVTDLVIARLYCAFDHAVNPTSAENVLNSGVIDDPIRLFDSLPQERRDIILAGVHDVISTPRITPEQLHQRWVGRMESKDWKRAPATTNVGRKEHANLKAYGELDTPDQVYARGMIAIVRTILASLAVNNAQPVGAATAAAGGGLRTEK